jgi:hypothetical protein
MFPLFLSRPYGDIADGLDLKIVEVNCQRSICFSVIRLYFNAALRFT